MIAEPALDASFLGQYDVLILGDLQAWTFSEEERASVEAWVRGDRGGIIALTAFSSELEEPEGSNQLVAFSGVRFNGIRTASSSAGQSVPVYFGDGTTDLKSCLSWTLGSVAIITTPIEFAPQAGATAPLTRGLRYVGAFEGFGVAAPPASTVLATDPTSGENMVVAHEVDGTGRVLAVGDDWILYANRWEPGGDPANRQEDAYNPCWVPPEADPNGVGYHHSVATLYQTKQFWYNAIRWVAPPSDCEFVVTDPRVTMEP